MMTMNDVVESYRQERGQALAFLANAADQTQPQLLASCQALITSFNRRILAQPIDANSNPSQTLLAAFIEENNRKATAMRERDPDPKYQYTVTDSATRDAKHSAVGTQEQQTKDLKDRLFDSFQNAINEELAPRGFQINVSRAPDGRVALERLERTAGYSEAQEVEVERRAAERAAQRQAQREAQSAQRLAARRSAAAPPPLDTTRADSTEAIAVAAAAEPDPRPATAAATEAEAERNEAEAARMREHTNARRFNFDTQNTATAAAAPEPRSAIAADSTSISAARPARPLSEAASAQSQPPIFHYLSVFGNQSPFIPIAAEANANPATQKRVRLAQTGSGARGDIKFAPNGTLTSPLPVTKVALAAAQIQALHTSGLELVNPAGYKTVLKKNGNTFSATFREADMVEIDGLSAKENSQRQMLAVMSTTLWVRDNGGATLQVDSQNIAHIAAIQALADTLTAAGKPTTIKLSPQAQALVAQNNAQYQESLAQARALAPSLLHQLKVTQPGANAAASVTRDYVETLPNRVQPMISAAAVAADVGTARASLATSAVAAAAGDVSPPSRLRTLSSQARAPIMPFAVLNPTHTAAAAAAPDPILGQSAPPPLEPRREAPPPQPEPRVLTAAAAAADTHQAAAPVDPQPVAAPPTVDSFQARVDSGEIVMVHDPLFASENADAGGDARLAAAAAAPEPEPLQPAAAAAAPEPEPLQPAAAAAPEPEPLRPAAAAQDSAPPLDPRPVAVADSQTGPSLVSEGAPPVVDRDAGARDLFAQDVDPFGQSAAQSRATVSHAAAATTGRPAASGSQALANLFGDSDPFSADAPVPEQPRPKATVSASLFGDSDPFADNYEIADSRIIPTRPQPAFMHTATAATVTDGLQAPPAPGFSRSG